MGTNGCSEVDLHAWVEEARRDAEYTALALAALRGEPEALEELRYRFPWRDGPRQRWDEIPSQEVRNLVRLAMTDPGPQPIPHLRHLLHVRVAVQTATSWNECQTGAIEQLVEAN